VEYAYDVSDKLYYQMKLTLSVKLADVKTIRELSEFLLITHAELSSTYSGVITASVLYLTLSVTVASAEKSFSKLKLIWLSYRGMLSIESLRLNDLSSDHQCKVLQKSALKFHFHAKYNVFLTRTRTEYKNYI
jgi:hypothetical protein